MVCAGTEFLPFFAHLFDFLELFLQQSSVLCPQSCHLWGWQPNAMDCVSFQPFGLHLLVFVFFFFWTALPAFLLLLPVLPCRSPAHHLLRGCRCDSPVWCLSCLSCSDSSALSFWCNWQCSSLCPPLLSVLVVGLKSSFLLERALLWALGTGQSSVENWSSVWKMGKNLEPSSVFFRERSSSRRWTKQEGSSCLEPRVLAEQKAKTGYCPAFFPPKMHACSPLLLCAQSLWLCCWPEPSLMVSITAVICLTPNTPAQLPLCSSQWRAP